MAVKTPAIHVLTSTSNSKLHYYIIKSANGNTVMRSTRNYNNLDSARRAARNILIMLIRYGRRVPIITFKKIIG